VYTWPWPTMQHNLVAGQQWGTIPFLLLDDCKGTAPPVFQNQDMSENKVLRNGERSWSCCQKCLCTMEGWTQQRTEGSSACLHAWSAVTLYRRSAAVSRQQSAHFYRLCESCHWLNIQLELTRKQYWGQRL